MKITYKEIANFTNKSEAGIKSMKKGNPEQLELLKLGALCKKLSLSSEDIIALSSIRNSIAQTLNH